MKKPISYDDAIKRLEEIVKCLDNEETPIETSLELFKEGISLTNYCQKKLSLIEKELHIVKEDNEEGEN